MCSPLTKSSLKAKLERQGSIGNARDAGRCFNERGERSNRGAVWQRIQLCPALTESIDGTGPSPRAVSIDPRHPMCRTPQQEVDNDELAEFVELPGRIAPRRLV
jgi:hypothetical protein